jgi:MFS family permease
LSQKTQKNTFLFAGLVLFAINILNFYDRHVPGALVEPMRKEFHLNDTQIGLLGSAFIWLYAIVGVPLGYVADRWSRKKLLAWGIVVWSSLTALAAFATSYPFLLFSRLGVGVGEATCAPAATSWLGDIFPADKRSRALAIFMLGVPIGGALSYFFSGPIAQAYGWRAAMMLAAVPAVLLIPALLALPEPERGASEVTKTIPTATSAWSVLKIPTLLWIILSGALVNFCLYTIATFLPAFLSRVHHLSLANSGIAMGVVYLLGGVGGGLLAGQLGDSIIHRRKDGRLRIAALAALIAAFLAWIGVAQPAGSMLTAAGFLMLAYACLTMYYGLVYSTIQDIVPPQQRGFTMAIYFMAMYMCGGSFGPLLTGRLSDYLSHRAATLANSPAMTEAFRAIGLQQAMLVLPVLAVALSAVLFVASRTILTDIAKRELAAQTTTVTNG